MPEFDRLKAESLMATAATSPAYDTIESIPSLLTGRPVLEAEPAGKRELTLQFADETSGKFSETPNIFSEAQRIGGNGAVVGWYHSYCRVIGKSLSACRWEGETFSKNGSVFALMLRHMGELIAYARNAIQLRPKPPSEGFSRSSNFEFFEMNVDVDAVAKAHSQRLAAVEAVVTNPNVDLAFIHLPFPHAPALFDRKTSQFVPELRGYTDNLALTDHVLGQIRNAMEQSGQWDRSTIVVSSDHPWRINKWKLAARSNKFYISDNDRALTGEIEDHRIPFFLKMPDQRETITYTRPFNTIVTHDLVLAVLKGEIFTAEDAKNWLDTRIDSERSAN
jgi:hypothetical protein